MFVSFSVVLLTLVAIVWGIIESSQGFYYVEVIPSFQQVDLIFRTIVCCVDDVTELFGIDYVDLYSKVFSELFNVRQVEGEARTCNPWITNPVL